MTSGRARRLGEGLMAAGLLALGLFIAFETYRLPVPPTYAAVGPRLFPFMIAGGLLIVGAVVLAQALARRIADHGGVELDWPPVAVVSAGLLAQMLLIEALGFILSTTILFVAVAWAFTSRRVLLDAAIGLVITSVAFVLFNWGLGLNLPTGALLEALFAEAAPP